MDKERAKGMIQLAISVVVMIIGCIFMYIAITKMVPQIGGRIQMVLDFLCAFSLPIGAIMIIGGIGGCIALKEGLEQKRRSKRRAR